MMNHIAVQNWIDQLHKEFTENIMNFWMSHGVDRSHGGFIGRMKNDLTVEKDAPKGLILNARILWTFSRAYRFHPKAEYLEFARRAYDYLMRFFLDREHGGFFWMVDTVGQPFDMKKRVYGQAFVIYALTEYARVEGSDNALNQAKILYQLIEKRCMDKKHDGYMETYERDWSLAEDLRLSEKDMDTPKSMNNHLHVLEAYTNLYLLWKNSGLANRLEKNIRLFLDHIIDPESARFKLFFDMEWNSQSHEVSFGHDIEGSWLLVEAAEALGKPEILKEAEDMAVRMSDAVLEVAVDQDGGLFYEGDTDRKIIDKDKHWWPQAEAMVGFLNAYQISGGDSFLKASKASWDFINRSIIDHQNGEWFWKVDQAGIPDEYEYKISEWKCPYHNGRACMETIQRLEKLI